MRYSNQQKLFLTNNNYKHIFINAGPGTGKTTLIKEKIKRILSRNQKAKILYITFSVKLAYKVKHDLNAQFLRNIHVGTIHSLLIKFLKKQLNLNFIIVERRNLQLTKVNQLTFTDIEKITLKNITRFKEWIKKTYRYIFIDEVQDINENIARLVSSLAEPDTPYSLYLLGDTNQTIYQKNTSDIKIISLIEDNKYIHKLYLHHSFRLGQKTCNLINLLFNIKLTSKKGQTELLNFLNINQNSKVPKMLSILLSKWLKTTTQLAEEYLSRTEKLLEINIKAENKSVAILARHNKTIDKLLDYFLKKNFPVHKIGTLLKTEQEFINSYQQFLYQALNQNYINIESIPHNLKLLLQATRLPKTFINDFLKTTSISKNIELLYTAKKFLENTEDTTAINLSTIHKAKGLEFETVILTDFYNNIYDFTKTYDRNLLFVALTRHLKQLIIITNLKTLNQLPNKGKILKKIGVIKKLLPTLPIQQRLL